MMKVYLGIDVGSVSINIVVLSEAGDVIAGLYLRTKGRPIQVIQEGLKEAAKSIPPDCEVAV
jgi:activator of 2-hydroxyglutaryl-CoA dehydratase